MNMSDVRKIARGMGIEARLLKKVDMIRAIQRAEHNFDCYGTPRVESCQENECLWRADCVKANKGTIFSQTLDSLKKISKKNH